MNRNDMEWNDPDEFPEYFLPTNDRISIDVLIYCKFKGHHTIGWYNFNTMNWQFLCREVVVGKFKWRYFINEIDKY